MALKIAELMEAAKKLRLRKGNIKFRPRLIYLVETTGGYIHPQHHGFTSGQTSWTNPSLWFQCHKDAAEYAADQPLHLKARVIKLNLCAFEEPIIRSNMPPASDDETDDT